MKNHPSWLSPCPPPCLFWVFLSSSYFLLLPFLRQGSSAVTYCFVHMVICYFNNNSKKKKKITYEVGQVVTFQLHSGLWKQPNKGRARGSLFTSYIPTCGHRAKDVSSWRAEAKRQATNESVLGTLTKCSHPNSHSWTRVKMDWKMQRSRLRRTALWHPERACSAGCDGPSVSQRNINTVSLQIPSCYGKSALT